MSIFTIIGVVYELLKLTGIADWIAKWLAGLLKKWGLANSACQVASPGDLNALTYRMFDQTRPGWFHPARRLAHGLCWKIVQRNHDVLFAHTLGPKAGQPIPPDGVARADADELRLLSALEDLQMHDDFVTMVEDMDATFGAEDGKVGANPTSAFFDGTIIGVIRQLKAAGVENWIKWLPVVFQLISTLGPKVAEIVAEIRKFLDQLKSPKDALSDLIVVG